MEAEGEGKIVSSPRLITADQTKALIEQGTEYPYSVTAPNGATTIAFKKAVLKLEVTLRLLLRVILFWIWMSIRIVAAKQLPRVSRSHLST